MKIGPSIPSAKHNPCSMMSKISVRGRTSVVAFGRDELHHVDAVDNYLVAHHKTPLLFEKKSA
jgi:hypothetical protein